MSVLERIACSQNRNDEVPNQELAGELAETKNMADIKEVAENLHNKNKNIQNDCIKVLYEIGYINPMLIADFVLDLLSLLKNKNNRLIWGAMIALSLIADIKAEEVYNMKDDIYSTIREGSVITVDNGIRVLSKMASVDEKYSREVFPYLIHHIKTYMTRQIHQHAESMLIAVNSANKNEFINALKYREDQMSSSQ